MALGTVRVVTAPLAYVRLVRLLVEQAARLALVLLVQPVLLFALPCLHALAKAAKQKAESQASLASSMTVGAAAAASQDPVEALSPHHAPRVGAEGLQLRSCGAGACCGTLPTVQHHPSFGFKQYGCAHYRRRVRMVAPCCGELVWCRHCHNLAKQDQEQDPKKRHTLDRKAVKEVVCAVCDTRQPTGKQCINCAVSFGEYACLDCNFFDDEDKKQYHCHKCGICRVGGRENYFHCDTCNCCYAIQLRESHVCIENSMHHNCPVCFEYLFDSVKPIDVMPCGHTIHQECRRSLAEHHTYVCPVCSKSYISATSQAQLWSDMDEAVAATPMPEEYREFQVDILCNDCSRRSTTVFHVIGHKCGGCGGYNTRRV